jgi:hypothetical protein
MGANDSRKAVHGRATGVLFFAGFGSLWLWMGLVSMHRGSATAAAAIVGLLTALVVPAVLLLRRFGGYTPGSEDAAIEKAFQKINMAQWVAIPVAVSLLVVFGKPEYIVPAIATIVGVHLFPLAHLFRYPAHLVTGLLLVGWSSASVLLLPLAQIASIGAVGTAAILLASAACTLIRAGRTALHLQAC